MPFLDQIRSIARAGVDAIILREKDLTMREYRLLANKVIHIGMETKVPIILHEYPHVAIQLGIRSIHLPMSRLRSLDDNKKNQFETIGASVHSVEEALEAKKLGATYITVSHIFQTACKPDLAPKGISLLEEVDRAVHMDQYALGGIHVDNCRSCMKAGAKGVCLMSEFMNSENPKKVVDEIREQLLV